MRVLELLYDGNVVELDVEVLVHALERALELDVVLELHGDLVVDERLEEANSPCKSANPPSLVSFITSYSPRLAESEEFRRRIDGWMGGFGCAPEEEHGWLVDGAW